MFSLAVVSIDYVELHPMHLFSFGYLAGWQLGQKIHFSHTLLLGVSEHFVDWDNSHYDVSQASKQCSLYRFSEEVGYHMLCLYTTFILNQELQPRHLVAKNTCHKIRIYTVIPLHSSIPTHHLLYLNKFWKTSKRTNSLSTLYFEWKHIKTYNNCQK